MSKRLCRGWRYVVWAVCGLLLAACGGDPAEPVRRDALYPKIVLQTLPTNGVELAAWTPDDRYIVTAVGQTRSVLIWDVASGHILDRLVLPAEKGQTGMVRRLRAMSVASDGRTVTIDAETAVYRNNLFGPTRILRYELDLQTKAIALVAPPAGMKPQWEGPQIEEAGKALAVVYEGVADDLEREVDEILLPLPASHDGKWQLERLPVAWEDFAEDRPNRGGLLLAATDGSGRTRRLDHPPNVKLADADLSADGRWLAMLDSSGTVLKVFDTEAAEFLADKPFESTFGRLRWLDEDRVLLSAWTVSWDRDPPAGDPAPPPAEPRVTDAVVFDTLTWETEQTIPGRCYLLPAPDGSFFGAGTANCRPSATRGHGGTALEWYDPQAGAWQAFGDIVLDEVSIIDAMAIAPDGSRIVAVVRREASDDIAEQPLTLFLLDAANGAILQQTTLERTGYLERIAFSDDGARVLFSLGHALFAWTLADGKLDDLAFSSLDTSLVATRDGHMAVGGYSDDAISIVDLAARKTLASLDYGNIVTGGYVPGKPVFWAVSDEGGIRMWDTRDWSEMLTTYVFYDQGFMTVTPEGRYDSNIHPYKAQFRWLVPDEPFQSLNSDTFSRDYYTPGVGHKRITCALERNCAEVFAPVRSIADLNRTLPEVRITRVAQLPGDPARAEVVLEITEGVNPEAHNGKTRSGIFDPRLLRNHQLAVSPGSPAAGQRLAIDDWREARRIDAGEGKVVLRRVVTLPTGDAVPPEGILVTAYAFNEDRLKSETAQFVFTPAVAAPPRPRRAFVVAIGIDHYREKRLDLRYAGADAALMQERLGEIPGYETRHLTIATAGAAAPAPAGGRVRYVTRATVLPILALLAGRDRPANLRKLQQQGIDAAMLEAATPDDLVILSYSGHGWADKRGEFYIVPSEASWAEGERTPRPESLLSSLELAAALQAIDAGEMALIIDACHAAASVQDGSFKPGPLGDPGLGQLAFDKGVRILSATQADDVALENAGLGQGLLTYALAREGLAPGFAEADWNADGAMDLREWLDYAVWRLPQLSETVRSGGADGGALSARALVFVDDSGARVRPRIQKPSLFDFNVAGPRTVVREAAR